MRFIPVTTKLLMSLFMALPLLLQTVQGPASAMEPPRKGEIAKYRLDGSMFQRMERAKQIGNHRLAPGLLYKFGKRNNLLGTQSQLAPPPAWQGGLPATGTPKTLVLLVDFPDYPASASNSASYVTSQIFGAGTAANAPYDSLTNFYKRSSYNALTIQGNVLGWYRATNNRSYYQGMGFGRGNETLIKEAITYFNGQGHDFSQYDNDGNGTIDALYIKWTGPDNGWSNFWWAYQTSWYATTNVNVDGKRVSSYVWSWIANQNYDGQTVYRPNVDIHETGHLLGIPDYYDYDSSVGPKGGVGGLDQMDSNWGDHNAFSKSLLGWLTPTVVGSGSLSKALQPSGSAAEAVLVMPNASGNIFGEFFMSQYRKRGVGNDPADYPADGLTIWHVDATLNGSGTDYLYDNSYTAHKLLKLMQADGLEQIENNDAWANAGDFYVSPKTLTPSSNPNTKKYNGTSSGVSINGLSTAGATLSATYAIGDASSVAFANASYSVTEGTAKVSVTVVRTNGSAPATVNYATTGGSASSGSDFTAKSGTLSFGTGITTASIDIPIIDDSATESSESFTVTLSAPSSGMSLGTPASTTVTIADNESNSTFKFGSASYGVTEGTASITIPVTRTSTATSASVKYATAGGSATSGSDFTAKSGTLNFPAGTASVNISVAITNDTTAENNETFTVSLNTPSAGSVLGSPSSTTVTIADNDGGGSFAFGSASYSVTEGTASVSIPVTRSSSANSASIRYATAGGSATSGSDFTAKSGTLNFPAGTKTVNISVPITNDTAVESSETFTVSLSSPSTGAYLGSPSSTTVTILDNDSGSNVTALQNGVALTAISGALSSKSYYSITVPAGAGNLQVKTSGGTGDVDLYVRLGALPTTSSYGCRPYLNGNIESCTFTPPSSGVYYIMLNGYKAYSGVSLVATYSTTPVGPSRQRRQDHYSQAPTQPHGG